jgi:5'-3' exonuclease
MGIQGLWTYLNKHCYDKVFKDADDLTVFAGQTWLIDTSIYMYKFGLGKSVAPIDEFLEQARELMANNITPIYLFDGDRFEVKQFEHARRHEQAVTIAQHAEERKTLLSELETVSEVASAAEVTTMVLARNLTDVRKAWGGTFQVAGTKTVLEVSTDIPKLLTYMKERQDKEQQTRVPDSFYKDLMCIFEREEIGFYIAVGDAEQLGAKLCRDGLAHMLVTDDGDALAFGAPLMFRNLFRSGMTGNQIVSLASVLSALNLTHAQFIDVCIMCGCDYTASRGIPSLGPKRAIELVHLHGSLDGYLASTTWRQKLMGLGEKFKMSDFQYELARSIFLNNANQISYTSRALDKHIAKEIESHTSQVDILQPAAKKQFKNVDLF